MRNLKKFLALVLAMLMVVSASAAVSAYDDVDDDNAYAEAIATLTEYGIVNGIGGNLFGVEDSIERYQMALMMARALNPAETDWATGMSVFDDVDEWYGAIAYAYMNGIVTGIGNNLFAPHEGIKYQDALIMAVRALGYKVDVSGDPYWLAAYNQAQALGLTKNVAVYKGEQVLNRAETAQVITNMIKATPADGGATIEAKNFGVATAENTTTFVITATAKQSYAASATEAAEGYVGIQALANGIPTGNIIYIEADKLGINEKETDKYFNYTVDLVNYDAKTGAFDKAIIGADPAIVYNADISGKATATNKFKINGVTYYTVDEITGSALKNEIVIYQGGESAKEGRILLIDSDGDIIDQTGSKVAIKINTTNGVNYYADKLNAKVITEAEALTAYGVIVDGAYSEYQTMNVAGLTGNYQLALFDDDNNGYYDRAVYMPVYMSVYKAQSSSKETFGPMVDLKGVTYTETLTAGTIFTYTYNTQTKVVNVLKTAEALTGTLTKIDTTKNNADNNYTVKLTIDGVVYTLATAKNPTAVGATLYNVASGATYDDVKNNKKLDFIYDAGWTGLKVGSPIAFYVLGDKILTAKSYSIEETFDRVVLKELVSYDSTAIYANVYINGKLVKDVAISKIDSNEIAKLSIFQLSKLLSDDALFATGNVFRAVKLNDGTYQLSECFEETAASMTAFKLTTKPYDQKLTFDDGIMDIGTAGTLTAAERDVFIRTKDTTVFYFLKLNAADEVTAISTYIGAPDNSTIDCQSGDIKIYADKIGYGDGSYNGVASFVLVYYKNSSDIKGFGVANVEYKTAFVVNNSSKVVSYYKASAEDLGLTDKAYAGKYFYEYTVSGLAMNMADGSAINSIYVDAASGITLEAGHYYKLSSDNVVVSEATVNTATLSAADFIQTRYYNIGTIVDSTDKITTVKLTKNGAIDVKTKPSDAISGTKVVSYIEDYADGIFVGVVSDVPSTPVVTPDPDVTANATYTYNGDTYGAVYTAAPNATGVVKLYDDQVDINGVVTTAASGSADATANYTVKIYKQVAGVWVQGYTDTVVDAAYANGVLTINKYTMATNENLNSILATGTYKITITISTVAGNDCVVTYYPTIG